LGEEIAITVYEGHGNREVEKSAQLGASWFVLFYIY
jgi:hypothetical protein